MKYAFLGVLASAVLFFYAWTVGNSVSLARSCYESRDDNACAPLTTSPPKLADSTTAGNSAPATNMTGTGTIKTGEDIKRVVNPRWFHAGYTYVLTTVGSLISALIVAFFGITSPENFRPSRSLMEIDDDTVALAVDIAIYAYVVVWMICGGAALWFGVLQYPGISEPLADVGRSWLGYSIGALIAFFGLTPRRQRTDT